MTSHLQANAQSILTRIDAAAERADRDPADITIVAVSKTFDRDLMDQAYELGFRVFGESRAQEIREKCDNPLTDDAELHMIGPLQTNKIRQVLPYIDVLQTVDRPKLIAALAKELGKAESSLKVMVQVNVTGEEQKSGISPSHARELMAMAANTDEIEPIGLMTMAPLDADASTLRCVFGTLRELRNQLEQDIGLPLPALSMGMSDDFDVAVEEGATHVRIGRALFGERHGYQIEANLTSIQGQGRGY